jgi:ApbE superfamily uncharacterized protein (UPF0280 family)
MSAKRALLPDGRRLHLQHGPIDLVIEAFGDREAVSAAYARAWRRFQAILPELVSELALLRAPLGAEGPALSHPVARRMAAACRPHRRLFVTPMAAVAGAVADEVLAALTDGAGPRRAYVNNRGDISLFLAPGERLDTGIVADIGNPGIDGIATIEAASSVRGIATSGREGRSFSLGIADAVTVLARSAASADVAATLIANAVNADHPSIERAPAEELDPDSDLGHRLVTVSVGDLDDATVAQALDAGLDAAAAMRRAGLIEAALLSLAGRSRMCGAPALLAEPSA